MRTVTVTLALLLACAGSGMAGESLSPEALLPGHETTDASRPAMAFGPSTGSGQGKDVYLVVWQTERNEKADVVGLRLDKSGKALDQKPFVVSSAKDSQEQPEVAFGGGVFLVVWHDLRNGNDWDVYGARVSPEGKVLDPDGIPVAAAELNQCEPGVAWDGKNFQVLWRGFQGDKDGSPGVSKLPAAGYHVFGGRVSLEGKALDGAGVFMAKPPREYLTPRGMGMAAALLLPDGKLLASARSGGTQCLWRIAEGKPASEPKLVSKRTGFDDPAFATDGKTVMLTWTTFRDGGGRSSGTDKSGLLVIGADGEAGKAAPQSLSSVNPEPRVRHPAPVWDGKRFVVFWDSPQRRTKVGFSYEAVFMRCFAADGAARGDDEAVINDAESPAWYPAAASDGAGTVVLAYERHPKTTTEPVRIGVRVLTAK